MNDDPCLDNACDVPNPDEGAMMSRPQEESYFEQSGQNLYTPDAEEVAEVVAALLLEDNPSAYIDRDLLPQTDEEWDDFEMPGVHDLSASERQLVMRDARKVPLIVALNKIIERYGDYPSEIFGWREPSIYLNTDGYHSATFGDPEEEADFVSLISYPEPEGQTHLFQAEIDDEELITDYATALYRWHMSTDDRPWDRLREGERREWLAAARRELRELGRAGMLAALDLHIAREHGSNIEEHLGYATPKLYRTTDGRIEATLRVPEAERDYAGPASITWDELRAAMVGVEDDAGILDVLEGLLDAPAGKTLQKIAKAMGEVASGGGAPPGAPPSKKPGRGAPAPSLAGERGLGARTSKSAGSRVSKPAEPKRDVLAEGRKLRGLRPSFVKAEAERKKREQELEVLAAMPMAERLAREERIVEQLVAERQRAAQLATMSPKDLQKLQKREAEERAAAKKREAAERARLAKQQQAERAAAAKAQAEEARIAKAMAQIEEALSAPVVVPDAERLFWEQQLEKADKGSPVERWATEVLSAIALDEIEHAARGRERKPRAFDQRTVEQAMRAALASADRRLPAWAIPTPLKARQRELLAGMKQQSAAARQAAARQEAQYQAGRSRVSEALAEIDALAAGAAPKFRLENPRPFPLTEDEAASAIQWYSPNFPDDLRVGLDEYLTRRGDYNAIIARLPILFGESAARGWWDNSSDDDRAEFDLSAWDDPLTGSYDAMSSALALLGVDTEEWDGWSEFVRDARRAAIDWTPPDVTPGGATIIRAENPALCEPPTQGDMRSGMTLGEWFQDRPNWYPDFAAALVIELGIPAWTQGIDRIPELARYRNAVADGLRHLMHYLFGTGDSEQMMLTGFLANDIAHPHMTQAAHIVGSSLIQLIMHSQTEGLFHASMVGLAANAVENEVLTDTRLHDRVDRFYGRICALEADRALPALRLALELSPNAMPSQLLRLAEILAQRYTAAQMLALDLNELRDDSALLPYLRNNNPARRVYTRADHDYIFEVLEADRRENASAVCPPASATCLDPDDIHADPARFQFKGAATGPGGTTNILHGVKVWDPIKAGRILVWEDPDWRPTTGNPYRYFVVDGHHRLELAKRLKKETGSPAEIEVDLLPRGMSAADARVIGAARNIAQGRGTAVDAAKILRESGLDGLVAEGLSTNEPIVQRALALQELTPRVFEMVEAGQLSEDTGVLIGTALPVSDDPPRGEQRQRAAVRLVVEGGLRGSALREAVDLVKGVPAAKEKGLFGDEDRLLIAERARILAAARRDLNADVRIFRAIAREAQRIESAEAGTVDVARAREEAREAAGGLDALTRLAWARGSVVAQLLNEGSAAVAKDAKAAGEYAGRVVEAVRGLAAANMRAANTIRRCAGDPARGGGVCNARERGFCEAVACALENGVAAPSTAV